MQNMVHKSYRSWMIILALTGVMVDQATKYGIFRWLSPNAARFDAGRGTCEAEIVPGAFKFFTQYTQQAAGDNLLRNLSSDRLPRVNHGALFGIGNTHESLANLIFAFISVVAGVAIVGWS